MDLSPRQLDQLHDGFKQLSAPPEQSQTSGVQSSGHSRRKRPGT